MMLPKLWYRILCFILIVWIGFYAGCKKGEDDLQEIEGKGETTAIEEKIYFFKDVTKSAGLNFKHGSGERSSMLPEDMGSGAAFADYDNDGDMDIYLVNIPGQLSSYAKNKQPQSGNRLYKNNGDSTFTDVTKRARVEGKGWGMGVVFGDYDNDGYVDIYLTSYGPNMLYHNNGDGTFTDVTEIAGVGDAGWGTGAAFGDYDNDGDLDIYLCNYVDFDPKKIPHGQLTKQYGINIPISLNPYSYMAQENILYRNNGDGTFTDWTAESGVANPGGRSLSSVFVDFDNDNDLDLYVANDLSANALFRNDGQGKFTDISTFSWTADFRGSMGIAVGDYDNDGDIDMFVSHWIAQMNALYNNILERSNFPIKKGINFVDRAEDSNLGEASLDYVGWGTDFFDYDNDGDLDLFVVNGHTIEYKKKRKSLIPQSPLFYLNDGKGNFINLSENSVLIQKIKDVGRGAAFADYDNDGYVDILINNNHGNAILLHNESKSNNNWLKIKTIGKKTNRDGIGTRVTVFSGELKIVRNVAAGSSYLSCNSIDLEFGLGKNNKVDSIEVRWPSGIVQVIKNIKTNQKIVISEQLTIKN